MERELTGRAERLVTDPHAAIELTAGLSGEPREVVDKPSGVTRLQLAGAQLGSGALEARYEDLEGLRHGLRTISVPQPKPTFPSWLMYNVDMALDPTVLIQVARSLAARPALWRPHIRADADQRHFHRLVGEPHMSVWLICWMPGHDTGFHDHDGAAGAVAVVAGSICEERLRFGAAPTRSEHEAGEVLTFGPDDIHRVTHLSGEPAITIHAYSPQLRRMGTYFEGPGGVLMRRAQDEDEELRPVYAVA